MASEGQILRRAYEVLDRHAPSAPDFEDLGILKVASRSGGLSWSRRVLSAAAGVAVVLIAMVPVLLWSPGGDVGNGPGTTPDRVPTTIPAVTTTICLEVTTTAPESPPTTSAFPTTTTLPAVPTTVMPPGVDTTMACPVDQVSTTRPESPPTTTTTIPATTSTLTESESP